MPDLLEAQRAFASALLSGDTAAAAYLVERGSIEPVARLGIHRNTMLAALANAIKLSYPAVAALVGADFFEQAANEFARSQPPVSPLLTLYGAGFATFLAGYAPASGLAYLPDVARLEWAVETAARGPEFDSAAPLAEVDLGTAILALAPSLVLLRADYPAEAIWRAALDGDETALDAIDPGPAPAALAIWRDGDGADVATLSPASGAFLRALIAGADAETALIAAAADSATDAVASITEDILAAGFSRLTQL
jgi:hypothetical protein